jgi:hypothetical protein
VRLAADAATLFALVARDGARNTTIEISSQRFAPANGCFLNRAITVPRVVQISCVLYAIRAWAVDP